MQQHPRENATASLGGSVVQRHFRIVDLARNMIHLCGRTVRDMETPDGDIAIEYIGLRPGENLYEELLVGDNVVGTTHPMIMRAEERMLPWLQLQPVIDELDQSCRGFDHTKVRKILLNTGILLGTFLR